MGFGSLGGRAQPIHGAVAEADAETRQTFIRKTYAHLGGAILLFVALEYLLVTSETGAKLTDWALGGGRWNWLIFLGLFMAVGYIADRWAQSATSTSTQYIGLGLYVVAEVVIFCPLLYAVAYLAKQPDVIPMAGIMTLMLFGGLTATVFLTKKDFSFMRGALSLATMAAMGVIVAGIIFGFHLGLFFSLVMVLLASGYVLYYTSNIVHHYRPGQHVAASLALFAAIALLFWYIINILMELRD